jgi:hypothetical protein
MRRKVRTREEHSRCGDELVIDRGECCQHGLHHEGQAIDDGGDDQSFESEGQAVPAQALVDRSEGAVRAQRKQDVEAENRWRQHEGKSHDRFDQELPAPLPEREPEREWNADQDEESADHQVELERQDEGLPVHDSSSRSNFIASGAGSCATCLQRQFFGDVRAIWISIMSQANGPS